jgi:putative acetyltransferase
MYAADRGKLCIRELRPEDNATIASIIRGVFEEHDAPQQGTVYSDPTTDDLHALFRKERSILFVALLDGELMGSCGIYPTDNLPPDHVELVKFYLKAEARSLGIGRALLERSIDAAKEMGYKYMYLESLPHYAKAVDIYQKLGFSDLENPLGDSGHTTCNVWMIKKL